MHTTEIHPLIKKIIGVYYRVGLWHQGDVATDRELKVKLFYTVYQLLYLLSITIGAITHENRDESIYLAELAFLVLVFVFKCCFSIWKQRDIEALLDRVCVFTVHDDENLAIFNQRLSPFIKFGNAYLFGTLLCAVCEVGVYPFIGSEKTLILEIAFPLNYKGNDISFWIANIFFMIGLMFAYAAVSFGLIIFYLMVVCFLRYQLLGNDMRKMGKRTTEKISDREKREIYLRDLIVSIKDHLSLQDTVNDVVELFSYVFLLQLGSSILMICGSIYSFMFTTSDNIVGSFIQDFLGVYVTADVFVTTYFGNEIMLSSDSLSYCLFESDWYEQSESTKKVVLIFGEYLKQPQVLVVGKLYPLTLETFTRIINTAYSTFNILKSFK